MKSKKIIIIPLLVFLITSVLLVFTLFNHWLGDSRPGIMLFCEYAREGLIKQPANSYSNIIYTLVGLAIAFHAYKESKQPSNLMQKHELYPILMASVFIVLGAGSFAMHASNAFWGGFADLFGMFLLSSFLSGYTILRFFKLSKTSFIIIFIFNVSICSYIFLSPFNHFGWILSIAEIYFAIQLLITIVLEAIAFFFINRNIKISYGIISVALLLIAFIIWNLSRDPDDILCNPHSLVQGHAAWHLLNGLAGYFSYLMFDSEFNHLKSTPH